MNANTANPELVIPIIGSDTPIKSVPLIVNFVPLSIAQLFIVFEQRIEQVEEEDPNTHCKQVQAQEELIIVS